jgi:hypothetical protein
MYRLDQFKLLGMTRLDEVAVCNKFLRLALIVRPGTSVKITDEELRAIVPYPKEFVFPSMLTSGQFSPVPDSVKYLESRHE